MNTSKHTPEPDELELMLSAEKHVSAQLEKLRKAAMAEAIAHRQETLRLRAQRDALAAALRDMLRSYGSESKNGVSERARAVLAALEGGAS